MYPAFLPPTSLPHLAKSLSLHSHSICRLLPKACDVASSSLSPRARQLVQQQLANPLFDQTLAPPQLSSLLSNLQSSNEYFSLSHPTSSQSPSYLAADAIRQHSRAAISIARTAILRKFPGIDQPGGALYPEHRARACWRDLREFARVVGYSVACGRPVFSEAGLDTMRLLYEELAVPLDAMCYGVEVMAADIAKHCNDDDVRAETGRGFAHLLEVLERL